jgi:hypothetical protein
LLYWRKKTVERTTQFPTWSRNLVTPGVLQVS